VNNQKNKKIFVVDTNVLINDPDVLYKLGGNEIVIPTAVIKELDGLKRRWNVEDPRAKAARRVTRMLDRIGSRQDISVGAKTSAGPIVRISNRYAVIDDLANNLDNRIVGSAVRIKEETQAKVILVSTDGNMRNVTRAYGIRAENYPFSQDYSFRPKAKISERRRLSNDYFDNHQNIFPSKNSLKQVVKTKYFRGMALLFLVIFLLYLLAK
jgi:predicted ribonuclease YlaK